MCTEQGRHVPRERGRWMIRGRSYVYRTRKACVSEEGGMDDPREELCVQNKEGMCLERGGDEQRKTMFEVVSRDAPRMHRWKKWIGAN